MEQRFANLLLQHISDFSKISSSCYKALASFSSSAFYICMFPCSMLLCQAPLQLQKQQKIGLGIQVREQTCLRLTHVKIEICKQSLAAMEQLEYKLLQALEQYNQAESDAGTHTLFQTEKQRARQREKNSILEMHLGKHYQDLHTTAYLSEPPTTDFPRLGLKLFMIIFTLLVWLINYTFAWQHHQFEKQRQGGG